MIARHVAPAVALCALAASSAHAHGGRLQTQHVIVEDGRVTSIATFGLLARDAPDAPFRWTCQESIPDAVAGIATPGVVIGERVLLAGNFGIVRGERRGCAWSRDDATRDRFVPDVVRAPDGAVLAVTGDGGRENHVMRSDDGGLSFAPVGAPLPEGLLADRLRVAGSRIYVVGTTREAGSIALRGAIARSDDAGATWRELDLGALEDDERVVRGLEIEPGDPDVLFVVVQGAEHDRLVRTTDGGETWAEIVTLAALPGPIERPFALAHGLGGDVFFGNTGTGLSVLRASGAIDPVDEGVSVACLARDGASMWMCGDGLLDGFALARFALDAPYAREPALRFDEIERRACESEVDCLCDAWWSDFRIEAELDGGITSCDAGAAPPPRGGGCACSVPASARGSWPLALGGMVNIALLALRRAKRAC
ncbi:WD40/YVTN/BNR-like repeat-containing protein [Sandaracinus amylolyticus]|uniref:BNR/Asp-box repeat domain protein n=1 Tax=Sandaracinus amylolyticus TaxID=927083 RepID=A0A0F6YHG8_9BACT|nr:sialidase family protein [Sandaracinus amylolyticus]AKF04003.1 BNR/Asp-box repeat domain protein [Sandaracinus amylolyticus]